MTLHPPARVLPLQESLPLWSVAFTRDQERQAHALLGAGVLMRRAGLAVARLARALHPWGRTAWVACGPGGNGADGLHAAGELRRHGWEVLASVHADRTFSPDCLAALAHAQSLGVRVVDAPPAGGVDVAIDALLGQGANRPPSPALALAIRAVNACNAPCLAVDLPSGIHAESGAALGPDVVKANATLALLTLKPGLFTGYGREAAADLWFDDLGWHLTDTSAAQARLTSRADLLGSQVRRGHQHHKGSFGDALVIGGASGMTGAAVLAAHAALAAGSGRTRACLLEGDEPLGLRPECLQVNPAWAADPEHLAASTVIFGCGGGVGVEPALATVLQHSARLVLDADGLNAVARRPALQELLRQRGLQGLETIMTPHPLEAARLLGCSTADVQRQRLQASRDLAEAFGAIVVLKGSGTVIQAPRGIPAINSTGSAALATGGTGDVLAGWMGGMWAQASAREEPSPDCAWQVAAGAVWLHGHAAEPSRLPLRAGDLIERMRALCDRSAS